MSLVFDGFMFFNELDLLEIRLNILDPVVDKFVLVEGTHTHSGKPKKLYYDEAKDEPRFIKFKDKITHIIDKSCIDKISRCGRRVIEISQRNAIQKGFIGDDPEDILLVSDVDELIDPDRLLVMQELKLDTNVIYRFVQRSFFYYFNFEHRRRWIKGSVAQRRKYTVGPQKVRKKFCNFKFIGGGGWHYTYLGGAENVAEKFSAGTQTHLRDTEEAKNICRISKCIEEKKTPFRYTPGMQLKVVPLKAHKYIMDNLDRFGKYVYKGDK